MPRQIFLIKCSVIDKYKIYLHPGILIGTKYCPRLGEKLSTRIRDFNFLLPDGDPGSSIVTFIKTG
jgi:hypothetical protein